MKENRYSAELYIYTRRENEFIRKNKTKLKNRVKRETGTGCRENGRGDSGETIQRKKS